MYISIIYVGVITLILLSVMYIVPWLILHFSITAITLVKLNVNMAPV